MLAIGIMSGTSLDGVDVSLVEITLLHNKYNYVEVSSLFVPYEEKLKIKVLECSDLQKSNVQKICSLNFELGNVYKDAVEQLLKLTKVNAEDISFIAMHGQTIWHNPENMDGYYSSTMQIGEPSVLAYHFNTTVISNFRVMDMVAGGNGAPLVPFVNYILHKSSKKNIAFQNIGGIGNVTYIPKNAEACDIIAFDTGPGNMLIDQAMAKLYNVGFDNNGEMALKGRVNEIVLNELMNDEYLNLPYPKSTGREKYNEQFVMNIINKMIDEPKENIIATITAYTADSISYGYKKFCSDVDEIVVSGGGAYNKFIIKRLKEKMNIPVKIYEQGDSYEAFCFAILGHHTYIHECSNLTCVTNAKENVILGNVTYPPRKKA